MASAQKVIELRDVSASYEGISALEGVCLEVMERDFIGIIGPNGGGKTSLLKVLLGLLQPDSGSVEVLGKRPGLHSQEIGYVPQHAELDLSFPVSVWDVVLMGRLARCGLFKRYSSRDRELAERALELLGIADLRQRQIGQLSGGQRQRVFIARALAVEPQILLLDEPTASLDSSVGETVFDLLDKLNQEQTIILVTHDIGVISRHVRKIGCMNRNLHMHDDNQISGAILEQVYGCPVDLIAHGHPHRVLADHNHGEHVHSGEQKNV